MNEQELHRLIDESGRLAQENFLLEEMAELTKAIMKSRRKPTSENYNKVIREMVDVELSLENVKHLYLIDEDTINRFYEHKTYKLEYTIEELKKGETSDV